MTPTPTELNVLRGGSLGICREEFDTREAMMERVEAMLASRDRSGIQRYSPSFTRYAPNPATGKWTICY